MGRHASGLDKYVKWQDRLNNQKESGLTIELFCLQEGVSRSSFCRWTRALKNGVPEDLLEEQSEGAQAESEPRRENSADLSERHFVPISIKPSVVEVELPNGTRFRLPPDVGRSVIVEVVRIAGALRPWKAPKS